MSKLLTFLRSFQNSPVFANLAIHAWAAAWLVTVAGVHFSAHRAAVLGVAVAIAAAKEFWFDHNYEIPPQPYANAAQDFYGYLVGIALGALSWLVL